LQFFSCCCVRFLRSSPFVLLLNTSWNNSTEIKFSSLWTCRNIIQVAHKRNSATYTVNTVQYVEHVWNKEKQRNDERYQLDKHNYDLLS